jgi:phage terminase large subunit GpA-like protein
VRYICAGCKQGIDERHKLKMINGGRWVAKFPERKTSVGFHINALYALWNQDVWGDLAHEWLKAQGNQELLRAFINLRLGETFEEQGETVEAGILAERREKYTSEVPAGVGALVLSADVQHNRIEALITGFGDREQSWVIKHEVFWGDPSKDADDNVWHQLEQFRLQQLTCVGGRKVNVDITLVDSGDQTDSVYDYVQPRQTSGTRVYAIKGVDYHAKPVLVQESGVRKKSIRLFTVATFPAKDRIYSRLRLTEPGPGFIHLPDWATDEFLAQVTGEKKIPVLNRRTKTNRYVWVKTHSSNEALDLTVYALAGLHILQGTLHRCRDLAAAAALLASKPDGKPPAEQAPQRGSGGGWVAGGLRPGGWVGK